MNIAEIIEEHAKWLNGDGGKKANLSGADLSYADLTNADLSYANLRYADLTNADLHDADLSYADLTGTDLRYANLRYADLTGTDLRNADLRNADLTGADLDFSAWPLCCGSLGAILDDRLKRQILYHAIDAIGVEFFTAEQINEANKFHRIGEVADLKGA